MKNRFLTKSLAIVAVAATTFTSQAVPINFGSDWDSANLPSQLIGSENGQHANETSIKNLLNLIAGTTFTVADIHKTDKDDITNVGGQFYVDSGWNYLVVQYDGPNGGSLVIQLGGSDAWVPFASYNIWGNDSESYAVSHFSVAGPRNPSVPDGGMTIAMLGAGLAGLGMVGRRIKK